MFIDLNDIRQNSLAIDARPTIGALEGPGEERMAVRDVRLQGEASRVDRGVDLDARLLASVEVLCSRCSEPFFFPIDARFLLTLIPAPTETTGPAEVADDDRIYYAKGGKADLSEIAAEQIYLGLPLKPVCKDDCKGLCPECGINRNLEECDCVGEEIDPRLAPLLAFKRRNPSKAS